MSAYGRYALIYRIYAENELFMPGNNLFSCTGTKCLLYLNNMFRYGEHFVSSYQTKCFKHLRQTGTAINRKQAVQ